MIKLLVSYDCGVHYGLDREAEEIKDLQERMIELDNEMLRWVVEDDNGEMLAFCNIHHSIINTMRGLNAGKVENEA